ncbi:14297_t:CDS:10 [Funneliformis mosseae]|uniref:14297_t:CDS:1 n=1 Tax=Funneliformis mosseae TaxID=27381 RepID=A0A9N9BHT1_FUNMO|nr:14297_t:CDS:10 [Funneliformis mosseae]
MNSEIRKPTWDTYTARDLEILSDIITLATYTSHTSQSSIEITPISFMSLFRAHDVVLSTRRIDPKTDTTYYQFLLKLPLMPGNNWSDKFENAIRDIGSKTDIEQYNWLLRQSSELSESEYSTESNISSSQLDHSSVENITFDNFIKASENNLSFVLEHKDDNNETSVESSTKFDSQGFNDDDNEKQSHIKRDIFKIEEIGKSEEYTLKDDDSILKKNTWIPITNVDNVKSNPDGFEGVDDNENEDPQEMEELKEKLQIYFKEWRRYTIKIRTFRAKGIRQWKLAINFHQKKLLTNSFNKWTMRYQKQLLKKRILSEKCKEFIMKKYLIKWNHRKQYVSYMEKQAIVIKQRNLLRRYFAIWFSRYFDKLITTSQKYSIIDEGTEETLVQRVFEKWRSRYIHYESLNEMAEDDYNTKLMSNAFLHWKRVNRKRQQIIKEIDLQLKNKYFVEWYSKCLQKWKQLHRQRQLEVKILQEWHSWAAKTRRKRLSIHSEQTNRNLVKLNKRQ